MKILSMTYLCLLRNSGKGITCRIY